MVGKTVQRAKNTLSNLFWDAFFVKLIMASLLQCGAQMLCDSIKKVDEQNENFTPPVFQN